MDFVAAATSFGILLAVYVALAEPLLHAQSNGSSDWLTD